MNGAVDWSHGDQDSDGTVDNDIGVMANINRSEFPESTLSVLAGADDWSHVMYAFRQNLYFSPGETYEPDPADVDISFELAQQLHEELLEGMSADFDGDDDVDGGDFLKWQRGLSTPNPTLANGDADYDEDVDGVDLYVWQQKFGDVVAVVAESAAVAVAPAPAAVALDREEAVDAAMAVAFSSHVDGSRRSVVLRDLAPAEIVPSMRSAMRWFGHANEQISTSLRIETLHRGLDAEVQQQQDDFNDALSQSLMELW
jgi:hypothetical protein